MSTCDNNSVGVILQGTDSRYLLFTRATPPVGVAPVAGHVDGHGGPTQAAIAEVSEEVGLQVETLTPLLSQWRSNRCRRTLGRAGVGHHWTVYRATTTGILKPSPRETRNAGWYTKAQIQELADITVAYADGRLHEQWYAAAPGLEPVWVGFFVELGIVEVDTRSLELIDQIASGVRA